MGTLITKSCCQYGQYYNWHYFNKKKTEESCENVTDINPKIADFSANTTDVSAKVYEHKYH